MSIDIEQIYRIGYVTREKERDYDPLAIQAVRDAIEEVEGMEREIKALNEKVRKLEFMAENGLGYEDMVNEP